MTHRERFYAILRGERADRIPLIGRIETFYSKLQAYPEEMPVSYRGLSMWEMVRKMGWGLYGREANVFAKTYDGVEILERQESDQLRIEYHTPVGVVWRTQAQPSELMRRVRATAHDIDYPFKSEADYPVLAYIFEHLSFRPTYGEWNAQVREIGEDGISRCSAAKCPVHDIICHWMGYERGIYELYDHPKQVEWLLEVLTASYRQMQQIVLDSPADIVLSTANLTTMVTSPPLFRKYFIPYLLDFNSRLIEGGKYPMAT